MGSFSAYTPLFPLAEKVEFPATPTVQRPSNANERERLMAQLNNYLEGE